MRNRLFAGAAALAAATALIALPGTADASVAGPVLGPNVNVGDALSADLVAGTVATMYNPGTTTGVKCTASHIGGSVAANPVVAAGGTATAYGPVNVLTFNGCSSNVVGVTGVTSLTMDNLPYTLQITDSTGFPVALVPSPGSQIHATVVLKTLAGSATCTFQATAATLNGNATNVPPQINLVNQPLTKATGPSICFSSINFTASYGPVTDTTTGTTVVVN
ncbi:Tat pathway signal sequence domain protein [Kitasatospora sp. CB02891]|uniref:Tat pathway signal sequence domain protein n=1 Tax=Kitasatospora sp. CB02891 TaxID=2020329 RepID=UPI000C2759FF|nr:Tat pathway signal sequence domain protein [Kitasatospora sp. CB02891]PJN29424.1 Tat pathway signal sequence domain protein [Kitasatospora sp. CB02891]